MGAITKVKFADLPRGTRKDFFDGAKVGFRMGIRVYTTFIRGTVFTEDIGVEMYQFRTTRLTKLARMGLDLGGTSGLSTPYMAVFAVLGTLNLLRH